MTIQFKYSLLVLVFLFGYISFIPSGPFPIYLYSGLKLDVLFAVVLLLAIIPYVIRIRVLPPYVLLTWVTFISVTFVSSIFSVDMNYSLINWAAMVGYSIVTFLVPLVLVAYVNLIRLWMLVAATIVASLIIILFMFFGFGNDGVRFALGVKPIALGESIAGGIAVVDPNMTAAGLYLAVLVYIPTFIRSNASRVERSFEVTALFLIIIAASITVSRSAFVGVITALSVSAFIFFLMEAIKRKMKLKRSHILAAVCSFSVVVLSLLITYFIVPDILNKLLNRLASSAVDAPRLALIESSIIVFSESLKTILVGEGFMMTNPHNEILRSLSSTGIIGLISSALFLMALFFCVLRAVRHDAKYLYSSLCIIIYVLVISLFYGYTKLLWVSWMFLLFMYCEAKNNKKKNISQPPLIGFIATK